MPERNGQPAGQPTPSPWSPPPGRILSEPATPQTCAADYQAAADVRARIEQQTARQR